MINAGRWLPRRNQMTRLATITGREMGVVLASSLHSVVTAEAVARDAVVVEIRRPPGIGRVAALTSVVTRDVIGTLPAGNRAVVAREASARYLRVVHARDRLPSRNAMAGFARIARRDVTGVFSGCPRAVVAGKTVSSDARMIEGSRTPSRTFVAGLAACRRRNVSGRFALGLNIVVA